MSYFPSFPKNSLFLIFYSTRCLFAVDLELKKSYYYAYISENTEFLRIRVYITGYLLLNIKLKR
jgi:hypothetical protein